MKRLILSLAASCSLSACANAPADLPSSVTSVDCRLETVATEDLTAWREKGFSDQQTDAATRDFASCLGHPDSFLRDKIGYEGLASALRAGGISEQTRRDLISALSDNLETSDDDGFLAPFSALGLSELARTDRIEPFLSTSERAELSQRTADYISQVSDYRAFSDNDGWRHGVAHGADIAMQLALNANLEAASLETLRVGIAQQISSRSGYAFTHGEPQRLARPIYFMATHEAFAQADWASWFDALADPAPMSNWGDAYQSEIDLARLHNLKSFARVLYINASLSENEALQPISDGALSLLKALP